MLGEARSERARAADLQQRDALEIVVELIERCESLHERGRGAGPDAGHARDVVGLITRKRQIIGEALRCDPEVALDVVIAELAAGAEVPQHVAVAHQLRQVLVARDEGGAHAGRAHEPRERPDDVVGFVLGVHELGNPQMPAQFTAARELLVQTALKYLDTLSKESGTDRDLRLELARAYEKVADIQGQAYNPNTGKPQAALASYDQAIAQLTELATANPVDPEVRSALATDHLKRSRVAGLLGADPQAVAAESQQSVALLEELVAERPHEALVQDQLAAAYSTHAVHLMWSGQTEAAISSAYKGITLMEALHRAEPANRTFEFHLGTQYMNAGAVVIARGSQPDAIEEAQALGRKALAVHQHLLSVDPEHALRYQRAIGGDLDNIGSELYDRSDYAGAIGQSRAALDVLARTATDPNNSQARIDVARVTLHLARALLASGSSDAAAAAFSQSVAALNALAPHVDTLETRYLLATCEMGLGVIESQRATAASASGRAAQARHWHAAHDWFATSVKRYAWLQEEAKVTLTPKEARGYDQAVTGLARSTAEIARLEGGASTRPQ